MDSLESRIGYSFKKNWLKEMALTRRRVAGESGHNYHNEQLEFLGDSVFHLCISDLLIKKYPHASEGKLSKMRSLLIKTSYMAQLTLDLKLDQDIKAGGSNKWNKEPLTLRQLASILEAVIGAVYVDGGWKQAWKVVKQMVDNKISTGLVDTDYKGILQEFVRKNFQTTPYYTLVKTGGLPHKKIFIMQVKLEDKEVGRGKGSTKKQASQVAALSAIKHLKIGIRKC